MAKPKPRTGDRHVGTAKTIRFTDDEAAVLEAIKAKAGGTYAEAIAAAGRAYLGAFQSTPPRGRRRTADYLFVIAWANAPRPRTAKQATS